MKVILERPSTVERIIYPTGKSWLRNFSPTEDSVDDGQHPVYLGSGIIYEPVKFFILSKNEYDGKLRGVAYAELVATILKSVFPANRSMQYSLDSQYFATYNPKRDGILLYRKQGYQVQESYPTKQVGDKVFHVFGASAPDFLMKFNPNSKADDGADADALSFIENLRATAAAAH